MYTALLQHSSNVFVGFIFHLLVKSCKKISQALRIWCTNTITSFPKLYVERFLDNLIPAGDLARPFLCQFSPSASFKPLSLSVPLECGVSFSFLFPHIFFPRAPPKLLRQHAAYANHWPFILNSRPQPWMRPQENTHRHTRTHSVLTDFYCNRESSMLIKHDHSSVMITRSNKNHI